LKDIYLSLIGLTGGILCGLLGIGGGIVVVPALYFIMHLPFKQAIALSLGNIVLVSISSTIGFIRKGLTDLKLVI
jgi:uncharacterized membrane protein YfcA